MRIESASVVEIYIPSTDTCQKKNKRPTREKTRREEKGGGGRDVESYWSKVVASNLLVKYSKKSHQIFLNLFTEP